MMDTSTLAALLFTGRASNQDCKDWAINCRREGFEGEYLKKLSSIDPRTIEQAEVYKLVRYGFGETEFRCHPDQINPLFQEARQIARKILSGEIEPGTGVTMISDIAVQCDFPYLNHLSDWIYLEEGNHPDCLEKGWIFYKTNPEKWLLTVMREAQRLSENDGTFEFL
jgi:hypothetical protein